MKELAIKAIKTYQLFFSYKGPPRCKYRPTCSEYAIHAMGKYGFLIGAAKGTWRILRCNPLSKGGVDLP